MPQQWKLTWIKINLSWYCIVSCQINPHWISNSGLLTVVLNGLENWWRGTVSPGQCSCTKVCGCNGCCVWLWLWTGRLITLHILHIWHNLAIFCSSTWKTTWLGSSIRPIMRSYLQLRTLLRIRMRASIPQESKHCNPDGRSVWTTGEIMMKNKPLMVKFDHCIIVSLWTFQPTLVF